MSTRFVLGALGLLLVVASSTPATEYLESEAPAAKECQSLLQQSKRSIGTGEVTSSDDQSSDIVKKVDGDSSKKKSDHTKQEPDQAESHEEHVQNLKVDAAHKAHVLQASIAAAEKTENTLGGKVKRMGQDLEDARITQGRVVAHINTLESTLATAKETADSCLALSDAMRQELQQEKAKAQQLDQKSDQTEAEIQHALEMAASLKNKLNEMQDELEQVQRVAQQAKQLSVTLAAAKKAKHEIANQLEAFKHAMKTKMTHLNEDDMGLRKQLAEMNEKFEQAAKAAAILRPYTE